MIRIAASRDEQQRAMPGDGLVPDPMIAITHAITIDAPPERIWPWLAQMGSSRGGWYSYDRIDNGGHPGPVTSWEHLVEPGESHSSRQVVRSRVARGWKQMARNAGTVGQQRAPIEYVYRFVGHLPDSWLIAIARLGHRWMESRHMRGIKRRVEAHSRAA